MMRKALLVSLPMLAACGSGGGTSSGVVPVTTGTSPTPTPSATASPTPAPSYAAVDFSGDRRFASSVGAQLNAFVPTAGTTGAAYSSSLAGPTATISLSYLAQSRSGQFNFFGSAFDYTSASLGNGTGSALLYAACNDPIFCDLFIGQVLGGTKPTYVTRAVYGSPFTAETRVGVQGRSRVVQVAIFGAPTVAGDLATTAQSYRNPVLVTGGINNGASYSDQLSIGQITIDSGGGVQGTMEPAAGIGSRDPLLLRFAGTLDRATNRISGTITGSGDTTITGSFSGQLFGPQSAELGIAFQVTRGRDAGSFVGTFLGVR